MGFPVVRVKLFNQFNALLGGNGFDPIHPGSILALIVLRHLAHCQKACSSGFGE
jgi:hypothetical protein